MPDYDLLVRGAHPWPAIGIVDGRFAGLAPGTAREEIDATGLLVLPGVIDAHVHFNEPGRTEWEGWATGSRAAVAGGATTVFDMPLNSHPPVVTAAAFRAKQQAAEARAVCDFALWGGLVPGHVDDLEALAACGVIGFKAFMADSGIEDFPKVDVATLREGMRRAAALSLPVAVHAEIDRARGPAIDLDGPSARATTEARADAHAAARVERRADAQRGQPSGDDRPSAAEAGAAGRGTIAAYLASRPVNSECEAIRIALDLAGETGCALHVVHVSSGRGVSLIAEARARGVDVTAETCPHYLVFTSDDLERLGAVAKCAPPLRDAAERDALLAHVRAGRIDTLGSDHSPSPWAMKAHEDFFRVWGGIAGVQHLLPLLLDTGHARQHQADDARLHLPRHGGEGWVEGDPARLDAGLDRDLALGRDLDRRPGLAPGAGPGLDPALVARLTAGHVARRFRLPSKGRIAVGCDADLALVEISREPYEITADALFYRHRISPYVGRRLRVRVRQTILRGRTVFRDSDTPGGRVMVNGAGGRLLTPASS